MRRREGRGGEEQEIEGKKRKSRMKRGKRRKRSMRRNTICSKIIRLQHSFVRTLPVNFGHRNVKITSQKLGLLGVLCEFEYHFSTVISGDLDLWED